MYGALLTQTAVTSRKTKVKDNTTGYITATWATVNASAKCRVQLEGKPVYSQTTSGQTRSEDYLGFFAASEDLAIGDRVVWQGITLYVKSVPPIFGYSELHHKEAILSLQET